MKTIEVNGKPVEVDSEGYLVKFDEWSREVGLVLAQDEKLKLGDEHWTVIELLRDFYAESQVIPTAKDFLKHMGDKLGAEKGTHKYFNSLFPHEALKQCGKIAGLPMLSGCM